MIPKSIIDRIIPILKRDLRRSLRMKVRGFPTVYYTSFLMRDINWFNTWSSSGSVYRKRSDHTRNVYCDLRVGNYRYDQTTHGGLKDNDEELESVAHISLPIDDKCYDGLRMALWRLTDAKFREALADYKNKEAASLSGPDPSDELHSFTKLPPVTSIRCESAEKVDEARWVKFCKDMSKWMSDLPHISSSWVEFDASQTTKIFVNTEGSVVVQHEQIFSLAATFRKLSRDGSHIEQDFVLNCATQRELPTMQGLKELLLKKYEQLLALSRARKIHAFSGPVLLYPEPAGLLFHEAIGHRLEGSSLLSTNEGQTFRGHLKQRVLNLEINIRDNPRLNKFKGIRCIGSYDFDDEGTPSRDALLIGDGILKEYLNTRAALSKRGFKPNGHARNKKYQRPTSRMAVTIIEAKHGLPLDRMKELLIEEIKRQKKPFGMIVYETSGGETETGTHDFQAFSGDVSYATLIYPNGKEVVVRGVDLVGTPLQALNNIIAIGNEQQLVNDFCGAESGFIPISTISPAVLLSNLELQAKDEETVSPYILPKPKLKGQF